jgi:hypothetical protein
MSAAPSFDKTAPLGAVQAVIAGSHRAAHGHPGDCCLILRDSGEDDRWLRIVGISTLAGLCRGPGNSGELFNGLRAECTRVALETGAPDSQLVCCLEVISIAEALIHGEMARVNEIIHGTDSIPPSSFLPSEHACVAAQLIGLVVAWLFGDRVDQIFAEQKKRYGGQD